MTPAQSEQIPDRLLKPSRSGCQELIAWLHERGWRMSLLEVSAERRRRGIPEALDRRTTTPKDGHP
jgi:hypothetical protein